MQQEEHNFIFRDVYTVGSSGVTKGFHITVKVQTRLRKHTLSPKLFLFLLNDKRGKFSPKFKSLESVNITFLRLTTPDVASMAQ